ncbi:hypothetical protein [Paenibacillus chungangensis]|uniref:Uncharacterized protein n=1 Tax=Paenibacillus chungangensis TaxID=696535 RepID=A0ABW3HUT4_9BACL
MARRNVSRSVSRSSSKRSSNSIRNSVRRSGRSDRETFTVYVIQAWRWKEFIAFEMIGGAAFYLFGKWMLQVEWFGLMANLAGPQMLRHALGMHSI